MKRRILLFEDGKVSKLTVEAPGALRWTSWDRVSNSALVVGDRGTVLEYGDGSFRALKNPTSHDLRCVDFHPDGGLAYACGNAGTLIQVKEGSARQSTIDGRENLRRVAWSRTGKRALAVGNNGAAYELRLDGGVDRVFGAETHLRSVAWHPKEDFALVTGNCFRDSIGGLTPSPNLFEYRHGSLKELTDLEGSRDDLTSASWDPRGSACLLAGFDQTWHTAALLSYSGGTLRKVPWGEEKLFPTACAWNPSGSHALLGTSPLTEAEGTAALFKYDASHGIEKVSDLDGFGVSCIAWGDDMRALITCSRHVRAFSS